MCPFEEDLCPPEDMCAAVSVYELRRVCAAQRLFDRRQRRVKVSVGTLVCQCMATVSAQGTPPQTTDVSCVPQEAYVRSRWGREESVSLNGPHESLSLSCFLGILYLPLFFMSSLSTALPFILLPDADTQHTHMQAEQITCPCSLQPGPCWLGLLKHSDD